MYMCPKRGDRSSSDLPQICPKRRDRSGARSVICPLISDRLSLHFGPGFRLAARLRRPLEEGSRGDCAGAVAALPGQTPLGGVALLVIEVTLLCAVDEAAFL